MLDISVIVYEWLKCSQDVWNKWFVNREDGHHEYISVEHVLLDTMVVSILRNKGYNISGIDVFEYIQVQYIKDIHDSRTICHSQKAGNTYCKAETVNILKDQMFFIESIDSMGTILQGLPYVEVVFDGKILLVLYCIY